MVLSFIVEFSFSLSIIWLFPFIDSTSEYDKSESEELDKLNDESDWIWLLSGWLSLLESCLF